jgi:PAS domain S-box-containing protein
MFHKKRNIHYQKGGTMSDAQELSTQELNEKTIAFQQALKYATDLATIYEAEKAKRKALEAANSQIRAIIDSINDGMLATDAQFVIIEVNEVFCRFMELEKKRLIGIKIFDLITVPFKEHLDPLIKGAQSSVRFELTMNHPVNRTFLAAASKIRNSDGYVFVFQDITNQNRVKNLKYEFLNILSHELKTPLNGILGFTELLMLELTGKIGKDSFEYIEYIKKLGFDMLHIVKELLNLADTQKYEEQLFGQADDIYLVGHEKPSSKKMMTMLKNYRLFNHPVNLESLIINVIAGLKQKADEKAIKIDVQKKSADTGFIGHESLLKELFFHLIHNAISFGKQHGHVTILLKQTDTAYEISVADDGIGIPATDTDKIFDSFYQVEEHMTRSVGGLGLGLTIATHAARIHGGSIRIESKLNIGTTVFVHLPKAPDFGKSGIGV